MEIHVVHLFAEKAKIFDQYSLIIVHWQNDKREKERAKEEDERENKLEEAEANSRLGREMKEREKLSGPPPTKVSRNKIEIICPLFLREWGPKHWT